MTHFYERNITDIKQEYTIFLINVLSPLIYEGIKGLYDEAKKTEDKFTEAQKTHQNINNPGVLKLFQKFLLNIQNLNNHHIENETIRIRDNSKIADIFDDLIRAVVKSNIVLLTYNASGKTCTLVKERYHENIDIKEFIHKCYIECAKSFYNYPELFWHKYSTIDIQRNKRESHEIIKKAINEAIRKIIPMKLILEEYLSKDYIKDSGNIGSDVNDAEYMNIRNMLARDLHNKEERKILEESYSSDSNDRDLDDNNYSSESEDENTNNKTNEENDLENLILEGGSSSEEKESKNENYNDVDETNEVNNDKENDKQPKSKDIQINFGDRQSASSKIFQHALAAIDKPKQNNSIENEEHTENVNTKKPTNESPINISRKGKIAHQGLKEDNKHIKHNTNTPQSEIMDNLLN